jgi:DNA-directed RNA polymerase subunit M/transcription elongation factor TFIIS
MDFCPQCERVLRKKTANNILKYICEGCGNTYDGDASGTLIASSFTGETKDIQPSINSAFDRVNKRLPIACEGCKIPFTTMVSTNHRSWIICTCGWMKKYSDHDAVIIT